MGSGIWRRRAEKTWRSIKTAVKDNFLKEKTAFTAADFGNYNVITVPLFPFMASDTAEREVIRTLPSATASR